MQRTRPRVRGLNLPYLVKAAPCGRRAALRPMQPQALARGVRPAGRSPPGARREAAGRRRGSRYQAVNSPFAAPDQRQPSWRWQAGPHWTDHRRQDQHRPDRQVRVRGHPLTPPSRARSNRSCLARTSRMARCFPSTRRGAADLVSGGRRAGCSPPWLRRPSSYAASAGRSLTRSRTFYIQVLDSQQAVPIPYITF